MVTLDEALKEIENRDPFNTQDDPRKAYTKYGNEVITESKMTGDVPNAPSPSSEAVSEQAANTVEQYNGPTFEDLLGGKTERIDPKTGEKFFMGTGDRFQQGEKMGQTPALVDFNNPSERAPMPVQKRDQSYGQVQIGYDAGGVSHPVSGTISKRFNGTPEEVIKQIDAERAATALTRERQVQGAEQSIEQKRYAAAQKAAFAKQEEFKKYGAGDERITGARVRLGAHAKIMQERDPEKRAAMFADSRYQRASLEKAQDVMSGRDKTGARLSLQELRDVMEFSAGDGGFVNNGTVKRFDRDLENLRKKLNIKITEADNLFKDELDRNPAMNARDFERVIERVGVDPTIGALAPSIAIRNMPEAVKTEIDIDSVNKSLFKSWNKEKGYPEFFADDPRGAGKDAYDEFKAERPDGMAYLKESQSGKPVMGIVTQSLQERKYLEAEKSAARSVMSFGNTVTNLDTLKKSISSTGENGESQVDQNKKAQAIRTFTENGGDSHYVIYSVDSDAVKEEIDKSLQGRTIPVAVSPNKADVYNTANAAKTAYLSDPDFDIDSALNKSIGDYEKNSGKTMTADEKIIFKKSVVEDLDRQMDGDFAKKANEINSSVGRKVQEFKSSIGKYDQQGQFTVSDDVIPNLNEGTEIEFGKIANDITTSPSAEDPNTRLRAQVKVQLEKYLGRNASGFTRQYLDNALSMYEQNDPQFATVAPEVRAAAQKIESQFKVAEQKFNIIENKAEIEMKRLWESNPSHAGVPYVKGGFADVKQVGSDKASPVFFESQEDANIIKNTPENFRQHALSLMDKDEFGRVKHSVGKADSSGSNPIDGSNQRAVAAIHILNGEYEKAVSSGMVNPTTITNADTYVNDYYAKKLDVDTKADKIKEYPKLDVKYDPAKISSRANGLINSGREMLDKGNYTEGQRLIRAGIAYADMEINSTAQLKVYSTVDLLGRAITKAVEDEKKGVAIDQTRAGAIELIKTDVEKYLAELEKNPSVSDNEKRIKDAKAKIKYATDIINKERAIREKREKEEIDPWLRMQIDETAAPRVA